MFKNCMGTQKKFDCLSRTKSLWVENNTFLSTPLGEESLTFRMGTSNSGHYTSCE